MLKPALATASGTKSGTVESPIVLDHACDHNSNLLSRACSTSGACSNVTNHALDASLDTCADLGADSTKWTTQNGSSKGSRLGLRAKASIEGHHEACCEGILVQFPQGKNHHISYPFGIHSERNIPWDYCSTKDKFYIQAKLCRKPSVSKGSACEDCRELTSIPLYISIMDRI